MALLNYAAQRKGKKGKGEKKLIFWVSASDLKPPLVFISAFCRLCKTPCRVMGEQSSRPAASVPHSAAASLSLWAETTRCHLYTGPHPPQINPNLAIKHGAVRGGRRQVIDILRCMSFVYVVTLSQGLSPWMTADPVCIRHLIREPCMSDCSAARGPVAFQQRTFQ